MTESSAHGHFQGCDGFSNGFVVLCRVDYFLKNFRRFHLLLSLGLQFWRMVNPSFQLFMRLIGDAATLNGKDLGQVANGWLAESGEDIVSASFLLPDGLLVCTF